MDASIASDPDKTVAIPPRYAWLKRLALAGAVLLVGLIVLRLGWGWYAERRLAAVLAGYRAAGQPVTFDELKPPPVADEENAATYCQRAIAACTLPAGQGPPAYELDSPGTCAKHPRELAAYVAANQQALADLRRARQCAGADWKYALPGPMLPLPLPNLGGLRQLAKLGRDRRSVREQLPATGRRHAPGG